MEPVRVLHIVGAMAPAGMENFIMNLYEKMDRDKIQFDMIVHSRTENDYVEKIETMGGKVYLLPRLTAHPLKNIKMVYRIVKENHYPVVIRHTPNALVVPQLLAAKLAGAVTVCHSHNETDPQQFAHKCGKLLLPFAVNHRVACSEKAGAWMYGKKDFKVIHNAINLDKFIYSEEERRRIRNEFHLGDCRVYGNVANFSDSKNHTFLLKVFKEITALDNQARLICAGDGKLRAEIEAEIESLGLGDKVLLVGIRGDVEALLSAFDVLIFPSKFEGLPLSLIEAQAAGLPALISDTITPDVIITKNLFETESIEANPKVWADRLHVMGRSIDRSIQRESMAEAGYDVAQLKNWYENYLFELVSEHSKGK